MELQTYKSFLSHQSIQIQASLHFLQGVEQVIVTFRTTFHSSSQDTLLWVITAVPQFHVEIPYETYFTFLRNETWGRVEIQDVQTKNVKIIQKVLMLAIKVQKLVYQQKQLINYHALECH